MILPGMERHVEEQKRQAAKRRAEKLSQAFSEPLQPTGEPLESSPLFRGTDAAPQRELFQPGKEKE